MITAAPFRVDAEEDGLVVTVEDASSPAWRSFMDASADVAEPFGSRFKIPMWAVATITWWWATAEARLAPPTLTGRAARALGTHARRANRLAEVLDADVDEWSSWPVSVTGPNGVLTLETPGGLGLSRTLRPFQADQVARLLRGGDGCNFSVPGSGKTTVAYAVWAALRAAGSLARTVVVAPLSAHESWHVEAAECFPEGATPRLTIRPERPGGEIVVVNYEMLQSDDELARYEAWLRGAPSMLVLDEAHRAKAGRTGIRGSAALRLGNVADHRFVLTGTPAPNGRADLAAMFDLAWPGSGQALVTDGRNRRCFVRATKSELGLPPQLLEVERVPLSGAHQHLYSAMVDSAQQSLLDPIVRRDLSRVGRIVMLLIQATTDPAALLDPAVPLSMTGDRPDATLSELALAAAGSVVPGKFVRVRQIVDENSALGRKTVVWASFRHHIDALARLLQDHSPAIVVGDTAPGPLRDAEVARFRHDESCRVLLATPQTLGEGISLHHECQHQVHVDRTYNAGVFLQSLDRTHRLGLDPNTTCRATLLVAEGTIDERIEARLSAKVAAMSAMLDDPDLMGLTVPDLDEPLSSTELLLGVDAGEALADLFDLGG